jgi:hypothetical protein
MNRPHHYRLALPDDWSPEQALAACAASTNIPTSTCASCPCSSTTTCRSDLQLVITTNRPDHNCVK